MWWGPGVGDREGGEVVEVMMGEGATEEVLGEGSGMESGQVMV
jgi:hypothetical protein